MPFKNFRVWRGKLPHWRADDVTYYVTFRHRRELAGSERSHLLGLLIKSHERRWRLLLACVLPDKTELIFQVLESPSGTPYELSDIVEKAKNRAGKVVTKKTGELFSPFYPESYDRIIRDEVELEQRWEEIFNAPVQYELAESPEEYEGLWVG